ncbi:MAG: JAB domain-containing protein [Candidatus Omnitrophica bacterium]|nr:JAB domain-containing protein [Candidatus Omnitrophota bacterium]
METQSIKSWPEKERPRERIFNHGSGSLSDAELVALLLRSGMRGKDVISFSRELLQQRGGLRGLFSSEWKGLEQVKGLGPAKIAAILAVKEICIRQLREEMMGKNVIQDPQSVMQYLYTSMRDHKREVFKVLFLDKGNRVIDEQDLFEGTVDQTAVHPREVVKAALDHHATAVILVHNHPSGRTQPSMEDRAMTCKLQGACHAVGISILDHIIIGDNQCFSFSEHRLL